MPKKCWCGNENLINYSEEYYKCDQCHSLVSKKDFDDSITHIKDEDNDLYGKNYWETKMLNLSGLKSINDLIDMYLKERCVYWLKYLLKYILPGSNIAEIGCGLGQFPYLVKHAGYVQEAFELSKAVCDYSSKELKINICNDIIQNSNNNFDGVLAFDLIEHLICPKDFISGIIEKLRPNGILCLQTPCYDEKLSYEEMQQFKPRFKQLLISNEHIYIFSKTSITNLLNEYGFKHINFEPAFFGDDYDMFVFASRSPLKINSDKEIDDALNNVNHGRIIKALITMFFDKRVLEQNLVIRENDANERLENIDILTKQLEVTKKDSLERLKNIEILTEQFKETEKESLIRLKSIESISEQLEVSEKDRAARLEVMNNQNKIIEEKEKEIENCNKQIQEIYEELGTLRKVNEELLLLKNSIRLTLHNLKRLLFHK